MGRPIACSRRRGRQVLPDCCGTPGNVRQRHDHVLPQGPISRAALRVL